MTAFDFLLVILCIRPDRMNEPDRMNVMGDVDTLAKLVGYADPIATVSRGQGQEPLAEKTISLAHKAGGWAVLQNIHLTPYWTGAVGPGGPGEHPGQDVRPDHVRRPRLQRLRSPAHQPVPQGVHAGGAA